MSVGLLLGHPLLLVFWASWCGPCHDEQPSINAAFARWKPRGVQFLGVDMLDSQDAARSFQQALHVPYQSMVDDDGSIAAAYLIPAAPALVLIDAGGHVVQRQLGGLELMSASDLDAALAKLV